MGSWKALFEPPELSDAVLAILLCALFAIDVEWLSRHPEAPALYESGVRYHREKRERWASIPVCLARGLADCEDLACWRAAELAVRHGVEARPFFRGRPARGGARAYHIVVRWPDGHFEDPSRRLGMR